MSARNSELEFFSFSTLTGIKNDNVLSVFLSKTKVVQSRQRKVNGKKYQRMPPDHLVETSFPSWKWKKKIILFSTYWYCECVRMLFTGRRCWYFHRNGWRQQLSTWRWRFFYSSSCNRTLCNFYAWHCENIKSFLIFYSLAVCHVSLFKHLRNKKCNKRWITVAWTVGSGLYQRSKWRLRLKYI